MLVINAVLFAASASLLQGAQLCTPHRWAHPTVGRFAAASPSTSIRRIVCQEAADGGRSSSTPPPAELHQISAMIDELLGEAKAEALPSLMSRRLHILTNPQFMTVLEGRLAAAEPHEAPRLEELGELIVTFLEEVTKQLKEKEPELRDAQAEADAITNKAAEASRAARKEAKSGASAPTRAAAAPSEPSAGLRGAVDGASAEREQRAKYRFLLEQLLDAAGAGEDALDKKTSELRDSLDPGFFKHLQWEVDEQREQKNRKLLNILETIVQRCCVEVESGQPEVALLSSLLQTANPMVRREMYERNFKRASPRVQAGVVQLITETQLELEKKVLKGMKVDASLLQQLRVLSVELQDYDPPSPDVGV